MRTALRTPDSPPRLPSASRLSSNGASFLPMPRGHDTRSKAKACGELGRAWSAMLMVNDRPPAHHQIVQAVVVPRPVVEVESRIAQQLVSGRVLLMGLAVSTRLADLVRHTCGPIVAEALLEREIQAAELGRADVPAREDQVDRRRNPKRCGDVVEVGERDRRRAGRVGPPAGSQIDVHELIAVPAGDAGRRSRRSSFTRCESRKGGAAGWCPEPPRPSHGVAHRRLSAIAPEK